MSGDGIENVGVSLRETIHLAERDGYKKKLAIVGASARAAAFSAIRAGFDVAAADLFADADLARVADITQVSDYPRQLLDWLGEVECDGWLYTGALENYPELVARMAARRTLMGNSGAQLRAVRDPFELVAAAADAGLHFPETRREAVGLPLDGSWLCKTYRGSSGSGVWRLDGLAAAERAKRQRACFQRCVDGESAAAVFVVDAHRAQLLGLTRQMVGDAGAREWHYLGSMGPIAVSGAISDQLAALGKMLAERFALRGLTGVDLMIDGDRLWIIEVNPRYSASLEVLERATGVSAVALHAAACDPDRWSVDVGQSSPSPRHVAKQVHAKRILYASREASVSPEFFAWAIERSGLDVQAAWLADIPHAGETIPAGRPVLTVFGVGASMADCEANLHERITEVEFRFYGV